MIEATVFQNVPLVRVADEVGLSLFTLIRQFKCQYRTSPHAWRMQARQCRGKIPERERLPSGRSGLVRPLRSIPPDARLQEGLPRDTRSILQGSLSEPRSTEASRVGFEPTGHRRPPGGHEPTERDGHEANSRRLSAVSKRDFGSI